MFKQMLQRLINFVKKEKPPVTSFQGLLISQTPKTVNDANVSMRFINESKEGVKTSRVISLILRIFPNKSISQFCMSPISEDDLRLRFWCKAVRSSNDEYLCVIPFILRTTTSSSSGTTMFFELDEQNVTELLQKINEEEVIFKSCNFYLNLS